jgi:hypothetical protein
MPSPKTEKFTPAVTFLGYPDDVTPVNYEEGMPAEASAEYVALLRRKGLVADPVPVAPEPTTEAAA